MKKVILFIIASLFIGIGYIYMEYNLVLNGFDNGSKVPIFIEYGTSTKEIVSTLYNKEIIKKKWPMLIYLKFHQKESSKLQAGDYIIKKGTPIKELTEIMSNARAKEIPVRIIEGYTIEDIDEILTEKKLIKSGDFIKCAKDCTFPNNNFFYDGNIEGYLFPDTYYVEVNDFNVNNFIRRMLYNFERRFLTDENKTAYNNINKKLSDIVIMASIIEKEERNTENMPIISGILWKRLKENIPLGADATTRYYENNSTGFLSKETFGKDNPYNTRRKLGLPPTAIGNPGLNALLASLYPENSKYYYYLHDSSGNIHYSITNDEHNEKKRQYIK